MFYSPPKFDALYIHMDQASQMIDYTEGGYKYNKTDVGTPTNPRPP